MRVLLKLRGLRTTNIGIIDCLIIEKILSLKNNKTLKKLYSVGFRIATYTRKKYKCPYNKFQGDMKLK